MAKAQVKVKVSSGKPNGNGTAIAKAHIVVIKTDAQRRPAGRPIYATKAQMNVYIWNKDGKPRAKSRFN